MPAATESGLQLKVGAGFSAFHGDYGAEPLLGAALWVDFAPEIFPHVLRGLGFEAEARGVQIAQTSASEEGSFRQATVGGGPIYSWHRYRNFHPYAKFVTSVGGQRFNSNDPSFHFEKQVVYAPGGGVDYRILRNLCARADYEYQIWPAPFGSHRFTLDPQGFGVGLLWDFRHSRER